MTDAMPDQATEPASASDPPKKKKGSPWGKKTSTTPTRIYKFILLPPTENADLVEKAFQAHQCHYNSLVSIDHVRNYHFRTARDRLCPPFAAARKALDALRAEKQKLRDEIKAYKIADRTRKTPPELAVQVKAVNAALKVKYEAYKVAREATTTPEFEALLAVELRDHNRAAHDAVAALRQTVYWGDYLLNESALRAARKACKGRDPRYHSDPLYRAPGRIGVHFQGGLRLGKLPTNRLMRIEPMPKFRPRQSSGKLVARGKAARTTLRMRIDSTETGAPIWASFPMIMDRPLPEDSWIKDAFVTRRPLAVRRPWQYALCIVLETEQVKKQSTPNAGKAGVVAINLGWRLFDDNSLRVAMVQSETQGAREIRLGALPWTIGKDITRHPMAREGFAKCTELQSILDRHFNAAKVAMGAWLRESAVEVPDAFREAFRNVSQWRNQHELSELVKYWRGHRLPGDGEIFDLMNAWHDRYRHLGDWRRYYEDRLLAWRTDLYRREALRIATEATLVVMDSVDLAALAKQQAIEEKKTGDQLPRWHRTIVAPSQLRREIAETCKRLKTKIVTAEVADNTQRCHVCGEIYEWDPAKTLKRQCPCSASWDQDENHTNNSLIRLARGEVVPLVRPGKSSKSGGAAEEELVGFAAAREELRKLEKARGKW